MVSTPVRRYVHEDYAPFVGQQADYVYYSGPCAYVAIVGARGSGKSQASAYLGAQLAINNPRLRLAIVSKDKKRLDDGIIGHLEGFIPREFRQAWNRRDNYGVLKNGSYICWRSEGNTPEDIRGVNAHVSILDEARLVQYDTFTNLSEGTRGPYEREALVLYNGDERIEVPYIPRVYVSSSPFVGSWLHGAWEKQSPDWAWFKITAADLVAAGIRSQEDIDRRRREYGDKLADQELDAEWVRMEGVIIDRFDPDVHVARRPERGAFTRIVGGVDFAMSTGVTAIEVVGFMGDGRVWYMDERIFKGSEENRPEFWADHMRWLSQQYGISRWYCDAAQPDFMAELQRRGVYGIEKGPKDRAFRINTMNSDFQMRMDGQPGAYVDPDCEHLIWELQRWSWRTGGRDPDSVLGTTYKLEPNRGPCDAIHAAQFARCGAIGIRRGGIRAYRVKHVW